MPTARTRTLLVTCFLVYFFANQTQVGWLYVVSALLAGLVIAAWLFGRGSLRHMTGKRTINDSGDFDIYEGDTLKVVLVLKNTANTAAYQLRSTETCPLAAPDALERSFNVFVPNIPPRDSVNLAYEVVVDRRGLHEYPPLTITTRAPFGLFRWQHRLHISTRVLIYPELRKIRRLNLLDYSRAQQSARPSAGLGSEVIGVRPFRTGDSPRHLHWRSVARTGQLISKEFADEAQPGLAILLDLFEHPYAHTVSKHTSFEWAIKIAASIGDYALRHGYPLYLVADEEVLPIPIGALTSFALLQYLARVQPTGKRRLSDIIGTGIQQTLVAAVMPYPDERARDALIGLHHSGFSLLAVLLDPASFPDSGEAATHLADSFNTAHIDHRLIRYGEDWTQTLVSQEQHQNA